MNTYLYDNDEKVKRGAEDSAESAPKRMRDDTVAHQKIKVSKIIFAKQNSFLTQHFPLGPAGHEVWSAPSRGPVDGGPVEATLRQAGHQQDRRDQEEDSL